MAYFTYILKSQSRRTLYKGHCQDLNTRITEHNSGKTKSTASGIPWDLVWFEEYQTREEAIAREKYLKTAAGRRFVKFKLYLQP
jgi:putative endonuclease